MPITALVVHELVGILSSFGFGCDSSLIHAVSKLDFAHLSGITNGVNQSFEKNRKDFNHLVLMVDV